MTNDRPILRDLMSRNDLPPGLLLNLTQANSEGYEVGCDFYEPIKGVYKCCPKRKSDCKECTGTRRAYVGGAARISRYDGMAWIGFADIPDTMKFWPGQEELMIVWLVDCFRAHTLPLSLLHPSAGGTCEWGLRECEVEDES